MRQLAIECASEACSVALFDDTQLVAHEHLELGRGHAERLIPLISELPGKGLPHPRSGRRNRARNPCRQGADRMHEWWAWRMVCAGF